MRNSHSIINSCYCCWYILHPSTILRSRRLRWWNLTFFGAIKQTVDTFAVMKSLEFLILYTLPLTEVLSCLDKESVSSSNLSLFLTLSGVQVDHQVWFYIV